MFPIDGSMEDVKMYRTKFRIIPQFRPDDPVNHLGRLRHLALRLFDFAKWPSTRTASSFLSLAPNPNQNPWLWPGFLATLKKARRLETLHIVVDRLFSASFDSIHDHPKDRQSQQLVQSPSQLRDVVASLPRDKYGFSDYDHFAARTKLDICFPKWCPPDDRSDGDTLTFEKYDPFFQEVLRQVRTYSSPPLRKSTYSVIQARLVVDLDSNLNGCNMGQVQRKMQALTLNDKNNPQDDMVEGYNRYFARPEAQGWFTDVSGVRPAGRGRVYPSTILYATLALFASTTVATPNPSTPASLLLKRQGKIWNKDGNDCDVGIACIARGGDPTLADANDNFSDGNLCQEATTSYSSKVAKGINDAGETGFCTITMKTNEACCVNGKCSAQEIARDRQVVKTTDAYTEETIQDVHFSKACPKGTYIQSERRLV
ncbi:hypothetical protein PG997_011505 [Apiospora hydei]|uniref:Uncharacterized protein n=1 Tax=Apiospora hydei TaxID=1337664 RepID=A0ABR1VK75_9PEZI